MGQIVGYTGHPDTPSTKWLAATNIDPSGKATVKRVRWRPKEYNKFVDLWPPECGKYYVNWNFEVTGEDNTGWLIQRIDSAVNIWTCKDKTRQEVCQGKYYEVWLVKSGKIYASDSQGWYPINTIAADTWSNPSAGICTYGNSHVEAALTFIADKMADPSDGVIGGKWLDDNNFGQDTGNSRAHGCAADLFASRNWVPPSGTVFTELAHLDADWSCCLEKTFVMCRDPNALCKDCQYEGECADDVYGLTPN